MAASRRAVLDAARHGEDFLALLVGVPGGDQRAAAVGRLDDDHAQRQAADQPVALRKRAGQRLHVRRRFADQRALGGDFGGQLVVLRRIDVHHAAGQHGDRPSAGRQRAAMRRGIDAAGQSADDRQARPGKARRQAFGLPQAVGRGVPRADDADRQRVLRFQFAAHEKHAGRIVDFLQAAADSRDDFR